jgi:hypothetical protein
VARVIAQQSNPWVVSAPDGGGLDPQRTDLWGINMKQASDGLSSMLGQSVLDIPTYYAQSLQWPELKIKADEFRRDSRPYNMPGFDEALDPVKITFIMDAAPNSSRIYWFLDRWRQVLRAGRGAMSNENTIVLNSNYRIDYAFNLNVFLYHGSRGSITNVLDGQQEGPVTVDNDLQLVGSYTLVNAWLGGFKIGDVSHLDTRVQTIEATFYVEDIYDQNGKLKVR